jgi:hypothetical protein
MTCSRHQTEVVRLLVDSNVLKQTLGTWAHNGSLLLHLVARYRALACMVAMLLKGTKGRRMLLEPDTYGLLPLNAACRNGAHPDMIDLLLGCNKGKSTVMREDHAG